MKTSATTSVLFENSVGRISYEPLGYLRLSWHTGTRASGQVRPLFTQLLQAQLRTGCNRVLIDERLASPFLEADTMWLIENWIPYAVQQAGRHHAAHLAAADVFARLSVVRVVSEARRLALNHRSFGTENEAVKWLLLQPAPSSWSR